MSDTVNTENPLATMAAKSMKETVQLTFGGAAGGVFYAIFTQPDSGLPGGVWNARLAIALFLVILFMMNLVLNMIIDVA